MSRGFVHATERNLLRLAMADGSSITALDSGRVVTNPVDPRPSGNYAFGLRRDVDLDAVGAAFRAAGRDTVHVLVSTSSRADLPEVLTSLGLEQRAVFRVWRAPGTATGAPGTVALDAVPGADALAEDGVLGEVPAPSPELVARRLRDVRAQAFRFVDGRGWTLLFADGPTTQVCHVGAADETAAARLLRLAAGMTDEGRSLWLRARMESELDRAAEAAGWADDHTVSSWVGPTP